MVGLARVAGPAVGAVFETGTRAAISAVGGGSALLCEHSWSFLGGFSLASETWTGSGRGSGVNFRRCIRVSMDGSCLPFTAVLSLLWMGGLV